MKKGIRSRICALMSLTLAIPVGLAAVAPATFADTVKASQDVPFVVDAQSLNGQNGAAGSLDLTAVGDLDWVHITGDQTNRKAGADLIEVSSLNTDRAVGTTGDSPMKYVWSDGDPTTSTDGVTSAGVFFQNPKEGKSGGYEVTIPKSDSWREMRLIGGLWQTTAELRVEATSDSEPSYVESLSAGGSPVVKDYTVLIAPGEGLSFTVETLDGVTVDGNASLAAVALSEVDFEATEASITNSAAPDHIDLTDLGTVDWLHLDGANSDHKASGGETITVQNRSGDEIDPISASDHPVAFSWSDGDPTESADQVRSGGVFSAHDVADGKPRGFDLDFTSSDEARLVTFVASSWNANVELSLFLDDESAASASDTSLQSSNDASYARQFEIEIPAGVSAKVTAQIASANHDWANIALAGIAVSEPDTRDELQKLQDLLDDAKEMSPLTSSELTATQLKAVIDSTESLLNGGPSSDEISAQLRMLTLAYNAAANAGGSYTSATNPGLTSSFGWEGDRHAPIAYIDGSYLLRDRDDLMITFGIPSIPGKIDWYNAEDYLPAFVSEYEKAGMEFTLQSFANEATISDNRYEIAYSRMTVKNTNNSEMRLPVVSSELVPLNEGASRTTIGAGDSVTMDFAIAADRFNGTYEWPSTEQVSAQGSYDENYAEMKTYWNERIDGNDGLKGIASINELPNEDLINAYKAGYIYTLIIRDDIEKEKRLHVGENGYDEMFDHDTIGIVASLLTIGDYTDAKDYLLTLPAQLQYDDAKWKYSWPYALYLQRTGDQDFIKQQFETIKTNTHNVETDRIDDGTGVIKKTDAIDSHGYWTIDNWSALAGLTTYGWIAEQVGEAEEVQWAKDQYESLLEATNAQLGETIEKYGLDYIPMSMVEPNEDGPVAIPATATGHRCSCSAAGVGMATYSVLSNLA